MLLKEDDIVFEYDKELILRMLKMEEFKLDELDLNQIQHVPMHQYRTSSSEKPLLLIENLQVCIGLYAYSKNFGFAAHLNPVVMRENEFRYDDKNIIYCNRIDDLFNAITSANIYDPVYIGISYGFSPNEKTFQEINRLEKDVDNLILKLNAVGIKVIKLDLHSNHIFIVDTVNGEIITPIVKNEKELCKTIIDNNF